MRKSLFALTLLFLVTVVSGDSIRNDDIPADTIRVRAFIDKEDILHVQGDKVWFTHVVGAYPGQWGVDWPTYVNEVPWKPNWDNAPKSDIFRIDNLNHVLPADRNGAIRISVFLAQTDSSATVLETPNEMNRWTLSVRLDNTMAKRAMWMDLEISWGDDAFPKMKLYETAIENEIPSIGPFVPPTVPSPTPVGLR